MPSYRTIQVFKNKNQNIIVPSSTSQMYGRIVMGNYRSDKRQRCFKFYIVLCKYHGLTTFTNESN